MSSKINEEWDEAKMAFPKLGNIVDSEVGWTGQGEIDVIDPSGIYWAKFAIKIVIPNIYPKQLPIIYEIGGKLKPIPAWHINGDGSCCVGPSAKIYRILGDNVSIKRWLELIVLPYFLDQVYKIEKGEYKGKVYSHNKEGLIEDYMEWWKIDDRMEVINKLKIITGRIKIGRNDKCFCGSEKKYKHCHLFSEYYLGIPLEIYNSDLIRILE